MVTVVVGETGREEETNLKNHQGTKKPRQTDEMAELADRDHLVLGLGLGLALVLDHDQILTTAYYSTACRQGWGGGGPWSDKPV